MVTSVRFGDPLQPGCFRKGETALEVFDGLQVLPWYGVNLDLQHIADPGVQGARNAMVGTVRAEVAF
jgi:carbohydrate-selective porin OprB